MQSGTSYFDRMVFKKTVLRFWPLWALYSAIWLIALPLNGLMMLQLDAASVLWGGSSSSYIANFAQSLVPGSTAMSLYLALIFGVLAAMAVFSHLYNARSANFFGTLPIRREGLFLTHYLAGLSFLIVPTAVIALFTLLVELAGGCVYLPGLLFWLGVTCGECFFFYSMAVFCAMFTGHILALPAFYGIFNALASVLMFLFATTLEMFYYGYAGPGSWMEATARWLTPVWALHYAVQTDYVYYDYVDGAGQKIYVLDGLGTVGVYALVGLVLTVVAFLLYRARRLESAGDVVSVRPMRPVFRYSVAVTMGLCFGFITAFFLGGGEITLMISIAVWAIIGCFAAQMLLDKSFKVFHKWKGAVAVTGAFIVLFIVVGFDLTGFETRVPDPASVEYIEVSGLSWGWYNDNGDWIDLELDSPSSIALMVDLHRAATTQRNQTSDITWASGRGGTSFSITYHLSGGSTLSRRYYVTIDPDEVGQEGTAAYALEQIFTDRDLYWQVYGFDALERWLANGGRLESAGYYYYRYSESYDEDPTVYYYSEDAQALLAAVEEDFWAGRIGVRHVWDDSSLDYERFLGFEVKSSSGQSYTVRIFLPDGAYSTLAALDRLSNAP